MKTKSIKLTIVILVTMVITATSVIYFKGNAQNTPTQNPAPRPAVERYRLLGMHAYGAAGSAHYNKNMTDMLSGTGNSRYRVVATWEQPAEADGATERVFLLELIRP
jgi:hypothetical protein